MTDLTQKQLVDLFNTEMAPFQKAMNDAQSKYEDALTDFAIKHLGWTKEGWMECVEEVNGEMPAADGACDRRRDDYRHGVPYDYWAQEYTLLFEIIDKKGDAKYIEDLELNTSV
jgi:hypothetical protein